jgi:hypothetical protein
MRSENARSLGRDLSMIHYRKVCRRVILANEEIGVFPGRAGESLVTFSVRVGGWPVTTSHLHVNRQTHDNTRRHNSQIRAPKKGVFPVFMDYNLIRPEIARPKASISEYFRGHFQPKSGKRTTIIAYSKNHVPEFAIFCNQMRKIIPPVGEAKGALPSESPGRYRQERPLRFSGCPWFSAWVVRHPYSRVLPDPGSGNG